VYSAIMFFASLLVSEPDPWNNYDAKLGPPPAVYSKLGSCVVEVVHCWLRAGLHELREVP